MKSSKMIALLIKWEERVRAADAAWDTLEVIMGETSVDVPLGRAIFEPVDTCTDFLAELLGDETDQLYWYRLENDMGKKGLNAYRHGQPKRPIRTLTDLAWLLGGEE